jgi:UDP-N-acetyl-D-glucosamine dehydrogenase
MVKKTKVAVIGQGYVGQTLSVGAADAGFSVVGFDLNSELIANLINRRSFVPGVTEEKLNQVIEKGCFLPTDNPELIRDSEIIVIAVPTPIDKARNPDLTSVIRACNSISEYVKTPALVISESTSYPGTLRNLIKSIIEKNTNARFEYAVAPERVDPGNEKWNLNNTTRVISGLTDSATNKAIAFYSNFCQNIYRASSPEVAEAAKLLENTFRQVNIALVNEFSNIMSSLDISANEVVEAASSKPFGFMKFLPSIGVGGHCIPVDPEYLTYFSRSKGISSPLIDTANKINFERPTQVIDRIEKYVGFKLIEKRIQIVGIAYKSGVVDIRESPAIELILKLRNMGMTVSWHDPVVKMWLDEESTPLDPSVDLGLIITPHLEIDLSVWKNSKTKVLDLSVTSQNLGWPRIL